jgi:tetratricopeptide (TPR) repeat protein
MTAAGSGSLAKPEDELLQSGIKAFEANDFVSARQIFSELVKRNPSAVNFNYLAMAEIGTRNLTEAIAHLQKSIQLGNRTPEAHYNLGLALMQNNEGAAGMREFREAIALDAHYVPAKHALGVALLDSGRPREAIPFLEQARKQASHSAEIWANLVRAQFEAGATPAAVRTADEAVETIPDNPHLVVTIADLCFRHKEFQKARSLLQSAVVLLPDEPEVKVLLAKLSLLLGDPMEALAVLKDVPPGVGKSGETMLLVGEAQALTGHYQEAEVSVSKAVQADPESSRYMMVYAWLDQLRGRHETALATLRKARELDKQTPVIPYRMAVSYDSLQLTAQAVEACEEAIRLAPGFAPAHLLLGMLKLDQRDYQGAEMALGHAVALRPDSGPFHQAHAVALFKAGSLTESKNELDRALALVPTDAQAYFWRARVLARQGARGKAIADLENAVALQPNYREAYSQLAQLYLAAGEREKAATASAKQAEELGKEESELERMLREPPDLPGEVGNSALPTQNPQ